MTDKAKKMPVGDLVIVKLRERAGFMREAGHNDDAELDEEAADCLTALEAENARLSGHIVEAQKTLCELQDETVRSAVGYSPYIGYALVAEAADRLTALEAENAQLRNLVMAQSKAIHAPKGAGVSTAPQGGDHGE